MYDKGHHVHLVQQDVKKCSANEISLLLMHAEDQQMSADFFS